MAAYLDYRGRKRAASDAMPAKFVEFPAPAGQSAQPPENFGFSYLPDTVAAPWREAMNCYRHGLLTAFAAMCRVTADAIFADLGESGRLRCYDELDEARQLGAIDDATFSAVCEVLLDSDPSYSQASLCLDAAQAAVLMEVTRDLLYQLYVRGGKLRSALWMRNHFAAEKSR